jgi:hypothetical protein
MVKYPAVFILFALAMMGCASSQGRLPPASAGAPITVAVWQLEDLSIAGTAPPDLGDVLSGEIVETAGRSAGYRVVERQRLQLALRELELGSSELADPSVQLHIGRIVGARRMIFGAYQVFGKTMRLDLRLVDVETSKVLKAVERTAPGEDLPAWLKAAREATQDLLRTAGSGKR